MAPTRIDAPLGNEPTLRKTSSQTAHRQTAQERIDSLLEAGRQRGIALDISEASPITQSAMSSSISPARRESISPLDSDGAIEAESSADEHTRIVDRENGRGKGRGTIPDYQATSTNGSRRDPGRTDRREGEHSDDMGARIKSSVAKMQRASVANTQPRVIAEDDGELHDESWWQKQVAKYGSIELENKGSVARDHLALERTFLAWLRTSLAFASIGIAITQLFRLNTTLTDDGPTTSDPYQHLRQVGKPLGSTFLAISIVVLFIGFHRYFESQHWIIRGKFPASRGSVALVALIALILMIASLVVVLVVEPSSFEKRSLEL